MHLVPAEGALPYRTFYEYIAERGFPVTQFIRHGSHPEFTPEPDMIHDCLGHVPPLMNQRLRRAAHADRQGRRDHDARRPGAGAEAVQLVQHRVRPDRGSGRDEGVRRRHPVLDRARSRIRCSRRT